MLESNKEEVVTEALPKKRTLQREPWPGGQHIHVQTYVNPQQHILEALSLIPISSQQTYFKLFNDVTLHSSCASPLKIWATELKVGIANLLQHDQIRLLSLVYLFRMNKQLMKGSFLGGNS